MQRTEGRTETAADVELRRMVAIDRGLTDIILAIAPLQPKTGERRHPPQLPRITRREAYEASIVYLRECGEGYTAALVEECLARIDRRKPYRSSALPPEDA